MSKLSAAYGKFRCVPRDLHPAWIDSISYYARAIGLDLLSRVEDYESMSLDVTDDWRTSLCKRLQIPGAERRNAKGALQSLVDAGLMSVESSRVCLHLVPQLSRSGPVVVPYVSRRGLVEVPDFSQTIENTQIRFRQTEEIEEKEQTKHPDAQARACASLGDVMGEGLVERSNPAAVGYSWLLRALGGNAPDSWTWRREYAEIGAKPEAERAAVARNMLATPYIAAKRSKATPGHLLRFWLQFVEGPRDVESSFVPAKAKAGMAPIPSEDSYRRDREEDFDWTTQTYHPIEAAQ